MPAQKDFDPIVRLYFNDLADSRSRPLSHEREVELAARIQAGDLAARDELVQANLRFVVDVAKKHQNRGLPLSDLISAGNMGLITAVERFDGSKGFKFISYAVWWIRQAILQALAEQAHIVRLPLNKIALLKRIHKAAGDLREGQNHEPTPEEISAALDESADEVKETLAGARSVRSLDERFDTDDERNLLNLLPDESQAPPDAAAMNSFVTELLGAELETLDKREERILRQYFGFDDNAPMTLEKIGAEMGITREWVRQLKERALHKLRHLSRIDALRGLDEEGLARVRKKGKGEEQGKPAIPGPELREEEQDDESEERVAPTNPAFTPRQWNREQIEEYARLHPAPVRPRKSEPITPAPEATRQDASIGNDKHKPEPEAPRFVTIPKWLRLPAEVSARCRITQAIVDEYKGFIRDVTNPSKVYLLEFEPDEDIDQGEVALRLAAGQIGKPLHICRVEGQDNVIQFSHCKIRNFPN